MIIFEYLSKIVNFLTTNVEKPASSKNTLIFNLKKDYRVS